MLAQSATKKRLRENEKEKPRKRRKTVETKIFYGFECTHCPQDRDDDSQVR